VKTSRLLNLLLSMVFPFLSKKMRQQVRKFRNYDTNYLKMRQHNIPNHSVGITSKWDFMLEQSDYVQYTQQKDEIW
jgi:hypothetical protein